MIKFVTKTLAPFALLTAEICAWAGNSLYEAFYHTLFEYYSFSELGNGECYLYTEPRYHGVKEKIHYNGEDATDE